MRYVHTTDRERFKRCRLQWWFASPLALGFQPIRRATPLTFGSAFHAGIADYYTPKQPRSVEKAVATFHRALRESYAAIESPTEEDEIELSDNLYLGTGMLTHYNDFALEHDSFEVLWTEKTFEVPIPGLSDVLYSLTPDAVVKDRHGRIWIMEHKTAEKLPTNTDYLLMDEQCGSYIWGLEQATGLRAEGVIYNICRKKVPSRLKRLKNGNLSVDRRTDTTYELAREQIAKHYGTIPEDFQDLLVYLKEKGNTFFFREAVRRNKNEIKTLAEYIAIEAQEMLNEQLPIYRNPNRFNCANCAYVAPCIAKYEGADYMMMLEGNYQRAGG